MYSSRVGRCYPLLISHHMFCALLFVVTPALLPQACLHLLHLFSLRSLSDGPSWGSCPSCLPLRDLCSQPSSGLFLKFLSITPRAAQNPTHSWPWQFVNFLFSVVPNHHSSQCPMCPEPPFQRAHHWIAPAYIEYR